MAIIGQFLVTMETDDSEQPIESPEDIDEDSYDMSNDPNNRSVSPKMSRPKLPEFIGNDRGCPSHHGRAKTDPGQGAEIKAIIDKTMEDIKELQQVDFTKTYSRPRVFPKHFTKSQSTHASPRASPIPSPSVEENPLLNRTRSRSLKVLTDMLKSGRVEPRYNIPKDDTGKSISDSQLLSGKKMKYDSDRRSSSDGHLGSPDQLMINIHNENVPNIEIDKSDSKKIKHADSYKVRANKSPRIGRRAKSECKRQVLSDDEGMDSDNELCAHSSHKTLGHTETNSQFLMFYKIGAPKRRPAYAGLMPFNKPSSSQDSGKNEEPNYKRLQRVELRPFSNSGRKSVPARHVTHPPQSKTTFPIERGSVDTNGFGSLQKSSPSEETPPLTFDLETQPSDLSLADSQLGQSVASEDVASVGSENPTECEKQDKKRGTKQKSKSDPSGSKSIDNLTDVINSSHSSPILSKDEEEEKEKGEIFDKDIVLNESKHTDLITDLDDDVDQEETVSSLKSAPFHQSQSFDETKIDSRHSSCSDIEDNELSCSTPLYVSSFTFKDSSTTTPTNLSPTSQYLSVPTSKKNIARSVSSASVLQRERKFPEKENNVRKHSIASSDEGLLFPPTLGDAQSTSMPTLCKNEDKVIIYCYDRLTKIQYVQSET